MNAEVAGAVDPFADRQFGCRTLERLGKRVFRVDGGRRFNGRFFSGCWGLRSFLLNDYLGGRGIGKQVVQIGGGCFIGHGRLNRFYLRGQLFFGSGRIAEQVVENTRGWLGSRFFRGRIRRCGLWRRIGRRGRVGKDIVDFVGRLGRGRRFRVGRLGIRRLLVE